MKQTHSLQKVYADGTMLHMIDGSKWEVSIGDNTKALLWHPEARLNIDETGHALFPFIITNLDTSGPDSVRARKKS
jgi:hypothetical protein